MLNIIAFGKGCNVRLPPWISDLECKQLNTAASFWARKVEELSPCVANVVRASIKLPLCPCWLCPHSPGEGVDHSDFMLRVYQSSVEAGTGYDFLIDLNDPEMASDLLMNQMHTPGIPVFLLSASISGLSDEHHRMYHSWSYVQGSADDEESWARRMNPSQFWSYFYPLVRDEDPAISTNEGCAHHVDAAKTFTETVIISKIDKIGKTNIIIGTACTRSNEGCVVVNLSETPWPTCNLHIFVPSEKGASKSELWQQNIFPKTLQLYRECCQASGLPLLVVCSTGKTASVIVALGILLVFFEADFVTRRDPTSPLHATKSTIQAALMHLKVFVPDASPPRRYVKELTKYFINKDFVLKSQT